MALIPLQTDIEKALTDFIRSEINNNSQGISFSLGFWVNSTDREGKNVELLQAQDNPYQLDEKFIVPMAIDSYAGNITNIEGLFNADYTIPLVFQINVDDNVHFSKSIDAINEFKNNLRGQIKRISVEHNGITEIFTAVTSTDNLTPEGNLAVMMGETYAFAGLTISFDLSKNINYGNQVWVYLSEWDEETGQTLPDGNTNDFKRIFALAPSFNRVNSPEAFQNFNSKDVAHVIKDTEYTFGMQMFIQNDDLHWNLLEDVVNHEVLNKPYLLRLDFKYYDTNNDLVTKFTFEEPVVILSAEPTFSIGEPQYLDLAFGKYFTATEIISGGDPVLETLSTPLYISESKFTEFNDSIIVGATFENSSTETVTLEVSLGTQTKSQELEPDEQFEFQFDGLSHSTNYVFNAVAKKEGFNNSSTLQEPITSYAFVSPENVTYLIGDEYYNGFAFGISNPYDYPINVTVEHNNNLSQNYLVPANTQQQFVYVNNNLDDGNSLTFNFVYSTLSQFGTVRTFVTPEFSLSIPEQAKVTNPNILNITTSATYNGVIINYEVQNTYNSNVNIYTTVSRFSNQTTVTEFVELNVPAFNTTGDTVTFSKTFTDESFFEEDVYILTKATSDSQGVLDSDIVVSDAVTLPNRQTEFIKPTYKTTQIGVTTLSTSWNNPNDLSTTIEVEIYEGTQPGTPTSILKVETEPSSANSDVTVLFDGLQPNTAYSFKARFLETPELLVSSDTLVNNITTLPPIQTTTPSIEARDITTSTIDVRLTNNANYPVSIQYDLNSDFSTPRSIALTNNEVFDLNQEYTGLSPSTDYTLYARAIRTDDPGYTYSSSTTDAFTTATPLYDITFNANGGTWADGSTSNKVVANKETGDEITSAPLGISRTGYTFTGWNPSLPYTVQTFDETLFAGWQEITPFVVRAKSNVGNPVVQITTPNEQFQNSLNQTYQVIDNQIAGDSTYSITVNAPQEITIGSDTYVFESWKLNGTSYGGTSRTFSDLDSDSDLEARYLLAPPPPSGF